MNKRTFTADEIARILNSLAGDDPFDLGGGLMAVRMASKDKILFTLERDGQEHPLKDAAAAELAAISAVLWEKGKAFIPDDPADELTPDDEKGKPDPLAVTVEGLLMPGELKKKPDPANLAPDPLGLCPNEARTIIADPELARRLATGTATDAEKLADLLTPEDLK